MKGIVFATAAIALGLSAGLAAPFVMRAVSIDIKPVAERVATPVTGDPDGLVGAAAVQSGQRRLAGPARLPAPVAAAKPRPAERARTPARPAPVSARPVDCRKYIPKSQITVSVPCEKVTNKDRQDDDRKETRKSRRDAKGARDAAESTSTGQATTGQATTGMCRRYVTRAGVTVLQKMPCHPPAASNTGRVAVADR